MYYQWMLLFPNNSTTDIKLHRLLTHVWYATSEGIFTGLMYIPTDNWFCFDLPFTCFTKATRQWIYAEVIQWNPFQNNFPQWLRWNSASDEAILQSVQLPCSCMFISMPNFIVMPCICQEVNWCSIYEIQSKQRNKIWKHVAHAQ